MYTHTRPSSGLNHGSITVQGSTVTIQLQGRMWVCIKEEQKIWLPGHHPFHLGHGRPVEASPSLQRLIVKTGPYLVFLHLTISAYNLDRSKNLLRKIQTPVFFLKCLIIVLYSIKDPLLFVHYLNLFNLFSKESESYTVQCEPDSKA